MKTRFLNVDLDIYSRSDLRPLVDALGRQVIVLHVGGEKRAYRAHLELASGRDRTADRIVKRFCVLIRRLPQAERRLWDRALKRDFSVGIQAGTQPYSMDFAISREALQDAVEVGARIVFTVYAPDL